MTAWLHFFSLFSVFKASLCLRRCPRGSSFPCLLTAGTLHMAHCWQPRDTSQVAGWHLSGGVPGHQAAQCLSTAAGPVKGCRIIRVCWWRVHVVSTPVGSRVNALSDPLFCIGKENQPRAGMSRPSVSYSKSREWAW